MARADYRMEIDFDNDGSFGHAQSDVSADLQTPITAKRGRNYGSQIYGRSVAGRMIFHLRNSGDRYNRFNPASPLQNLFVPHRLARLSMRPPGATDYTSLWTGYIYEIERIERRSGNNQVKVSCMGIIFELTQREVSSPMRLDITTADAMGLLLDEADIDASLRGPIEGNVEMARWWSRTQTAIKAMREVEETENGFVYETREGAIAMQDNADRTLSPPATYVISDTPTGTDIPALTLKPGDPIQDIINAVTVPIRRYEVGDEQILWTLTGETPELDPGETVAFVINIENLVVEVVQFVAMGDTVTIPIRALAVDPWSPLVSGTDYTANAAEDGSGANRTANLNVTATETATALTLEIENTHASDTIYLTHMQARGRPITLDQPTEVHAENPQSVASYGRRSYLVPAQFLSTTRDGSDYANFVVQLYKDPLTRVSGSFDATDDGDIAVALDLSQRIEVDLEGVAEDYFIENIEHRIGQGRRHIVNLLMSPAAPFGSVIVLGQGPGLGLGILAP